MADCLAKFHGTPTTFVEAEKRPGAAFAVKTRDGLTHAWVFNFTDDLPHMVNWDPHVIQGALRGLMREVKAVLSEVGPEATLALARTELPPALETVGHGSEWLVGADVWARLPPVPWVVPGLYLAPGRPAMLAGYGYSGKSVAAQALLLAVATGTEVWGQYRVDRGVAVHVDLEQGEYATRRRYQRIGYAAGVGPPQIEDRLRVTCFPRWVLTDSGAEEWLSRACDGASVCVVDSLRAATPGIDEKKN